jgi:hypothetical protein
VLLELDRTLVILDRCVYRELVKAAVARTVEELRARTQERASEQRERKSAGTKRERTPREYADAEHRAQQREFTRRAHAVNLDLGAALLDGLATVDPDNMDVARFFVLCRCRHRASYADRLTMRISRCRTRENGDEAGGGAAKARSGRAWREGGRTERASMDPLHAGAVLLMLADLGAPKVLASLAAMARAVVDTLAIADEGVGSGGGRGLLPFVQLERFDAASRDTRPCTEPEVSVR